MAYDRAAPVTGCQLNSNSQRSRRAVAAVVCTQCLFVKYRPRVCHANLPDFPPGRFLPLLYDNARNRPRRRRRLYILQTYVCIQGKAVCVKSDAIQSFVHFVGSTTTKGSGGVPPMKFILFSYGYVPNLIGSDPAMGGLRFQLRSARCWPSNKCIGYFCGRAEATAPRFSPAIE